MKLEFVVIDSEQKLKMYLSEVNFLFQYLPDYYPSEPQNLLLDHTVLILLENQQPFALCELEGVDPETIEMHGVYRQDWRDEKPKQYRQLVQEINRELFRLIFNDLGKQKIQIQLDKRNLGAKGFARRYGFKPKWLVDTNTTLYQLDAKDYFDHFLKG